jgi:hypothetical protein
MTPEVFKRFMYTLAVFCVFVAMMFLLVEFA